MCTKAVNFFCAIEWRYFYSKAALRFWEVIVSVKISLTENKSQIAIMTSNLEMGHIGCASLLFPGNLNPNKSNLRQDNEKRHSASVPSQLIFPHR